ncbi:MAG: lytic transglycosylase domain-containing protein [Verrucomicrobiota bacterium]|nr:lytic transglycosylase domain-containing protein [Verrucomicrobiota bacterium]
MKFIFLIFVGLFAGSTVLAQQKATEADEIFQSADEFLRENIDESVLDALGVDTTRARKFFAELQKRSQGSDVYDFSDLQETARQILPVLQQFEETQPYALWLKSRFDYFEMSDKLRKEIPSSPTNKVRLPSPSPKLQRKAWAEVIEKRPMPPLAGQHVAGLKQIFKAERVPPELVWLAEVESLFNPVARSPVGAVGLFQLMPTTARSLDLSLGPPDERLQPDKNGRAAARYLRQLHNRFGDWRLALAAYNAGETRVADLLKKNKTHSFDEIVNRLPAETQMYVPKVEATVRKREGLALADLKVPKA